MKIQVGLCLLCVYQCFAGPLPAIKTANATQDLPHSLEAHSLVKREIIKVPENKTCPDSFLYLSGVPQCVSCDDFMNMEEMPCESEDFKSRCTRQSEIMCESKFEMESGVFIECITFHKELEDFPCKNTAFTSKCKEYHQMFNLCEQ